MVRWIVTLTYAAPSEDALVALRRLNARVCVLPDGRVEIGKCCDGQDGHDDARPARSQDLFHRSASVPDAADYGVRTAGGDSDGREGTPCHRRRGSSEPTAQRRRSGR